MTEDEALRRLCAALILDGSGSSDFDLNPGVKLPKGRTLRPAGVLVAFEAFDGTARVVLTKRSSALKHHPGQIAFPGGKVDPGDRDATAAALREAEEEVRLPRESVAVLGKLPAHETVTGFSVVPVIGHITRPFVARPEAGEVDEVFTVPLDHVTDPQRFSLQSRQWSGQRRHYHTVPYGPYYIWGATARILRGLADRMTA